MKMCFFLKKLNDKRILKSTNTYFLCGDCFLFKSCEEDGGGGVWDPLIKLFRVTSLIRAERNGVVA